MDVQAEGYERSTRRGSRGRGRSRAAKTAALVDERAIEDAALRYLGRYDSSAANLREVLYRKVRRSLEAGHGGDRAELEAAIPRVVRDLVERRLVDDQRYAEAAIRRLRRRGGSRARIVATLGSRGVDSDTIGRALAAVSQAAAEGGFGEAGGVRDPELQAACALARRRRLGPWSGRTGAERTERRDRELGALARAGFSYDVAQRIVEADSVESLEEAWRG